MLREIKGTQRLPRLLALKVDGVSGPAAISIGQFDATLADNGVGDYTITPVVPFARAPIVVVSCQTAGRYAEVASASASAIQILVKNPASGAAADAVFHVMILGYDSAEQT